MQNAARGAQGRGPAGLARSHECGAMLRMPCTESERMTVSRRARLGAVLSATVGVGLIFGFQPPLLALMLSRRGASGFAIGAVMAASLMAVIVMGPFYPRAVARLGLRGSVLTGVGGAAVVLSLMPLADSVGYWWVLRSITGCLLGLSWIASEIWLNALADDAERGSIMGVYGTVFSAGVMLGPLLLEVTGTRGTLPFVCGAACLVSMLLPLLLSPRIDPGPQVFTPMQAWGSALARAPVIMLAAFVAGLVEAAELTLLPLFGVRAGCTDSKALLLVTVFMAGNVVLQLPIGLLADRYGRRRLLGLCALLSAVGPLLLRPWLGMPFCLWPLIFLWGGTLYAFYSQGVALLGAVFETAELPTANTLFVMVYCCGGVLGPSLGGVFMDAWPDHGLQVLLSGAAFTLLLGLIIAKARRRSPTIAGLGWSGFRKHED